MRDAIGDYFVAEDFQSYVEDVAHSKVRHHKSC